MKKNKIAIKRLFFEMKKQWPSLILISFFSVAAVLCSLYLPILVGDAIDYILGFENVDFDSIIPILIMIFAVTIAGALLQWIVSILNCKIAYDLLFDLRKRMFEKIEKLPLKYFDNNLTGEAVSKIINDTDAVSEGILLCFGQLFTGIVTIVGTLIFMLALRAEIALIVILVTPLSFFVAKYISTHTYTMYKKQAEIRGVQTGFIDEIIGNEKTVKAFNREAASVETFEKLNTELEKYSLKATFFSSIPNPASRFVNSVVYAGVVCFGAFFSVMTSGTAVPFTVGNLSSFLSYTNQYTKPFNEISGVIAELQNSFACASRIFDFLDENELSDETDKKEFSSLRGDVIFSDVCFSYNKKSPLIQNFSVNVKAGQTVAIVGPTGCGKTTLINLLMRFYDVDSGNIFIDGKNIYEFSRESLRKNIGMVLQNTWIKTGTVRENISMGKKEATFDEIVNVAKLCHIHSFIKRLPEKYDTVISESDGVLSQGQRQLLCIARIFLTLPPILILDEATSSIDTRTEMKIQKAFSVLSKNRTSFVVAHRIQTVKNADIILVMNKGNIIEQGTHEELIEKRGFYYELYNSQFETS